MIALKIANKKDFMSKLLKSELFDDYFVEEITIDTFNTFHIDGRVHKDFYKDVVEESPISIQDFSKWQELKTICFDLIKGKRTPLGLKFVFHAPADLKKNLIASADAGLSDEQVKLGIRIIFSNSDVVLTTGTAFSIFSLDKEIEKAWDNYIPGFLENSGISCEIL